MIKPSKQLRIALFSLFGCILCIRPAFATLHTNLFWASNYNLPRPPSNTGGYSPLGFGSTFEWMLGPRNGIEMGGLYNSKMLNGVSSENVLIPLVFRWWFSPIWSVTFGGYANIQLSGLPEFFTPYSYGIRSSIGLNFPLTQQIAYIIEVGGQYGLSNISKLDPSVYTDNQGFLLVGFRFGFLQRVRHVTPDALYYENRSAWDF